MEQTFPTPVDDVDPVRQFGSDVRRRVGDRPWVLTNMISSIDGATDIDGVSGGLGGSGDKAVFSAIRGVADVILVASGTVIAENYREPQTPPSIRAQRMARGQAPLPRIAIFSGSLSIDLDHRVFESETPPIVITHANSPIDRRAALAEVCDVMVAGETVVDIHDALHQLALDGAAVALLEGGPTLNGAFADEDLIDEWCQSVAPLLVSGSSARVAHSKNTLRPRAFRLDRTLHDDGFLFHRYLRDRSEATE